MQKSDLLPESPPAVPRARPLAVEDRQAMIIDAVIPLLLERGPSITSREIADAAGIAEGTVYRAFGDKESLIEAAVDRLMDPSDVRDALRAIDPADSLEEKIHAVIALLQARFQKIFGIMAIFGEYRRRAHAHSLDELTGIFADILRPDLDRLNVPPDRVHQIIRLLTFSSSIPRFNAGVEYTADELTDIVLYGIIGARTATPTTPPSVIDTNV